MSKSGNAAYRLSCAMRKYGLDSNVLNITSSPDIEHVQVFPKEISYVASCINKVNRMIKIKGKREGSYFYNPLPICGRDIYRSAIVQDSDVIYIHWVAGILSVKDISNIISLGKPVIFFMHDMWDFTGGCHHSFSCNKYQTGCNDCGMFVSNNNPHRQISKLRKLFSDKKNIAFVSPSFWMADCARKSYAIPNVKVTNISNVIDTAIFKPSDRLEAKHKLGLPIDKKIITFGCQIGTKNKFKGWDYLRDAINALERDDIHILIYGSEDKPEIRAQIIYPITIIGFISEEEKLATICNATDVYVSPSLAESFGLTFLENILCGTIVVGFNNTAIGEIVSDRINGYLAQNKNIEDLKRCIEYALDNKLKGRGITNYNTEATVNEHINLINSML